MAGLRLGRAAVFAGATLAGTACWTDKPAPRTTPIEHSRRVDDKTSALAPGTIHGVIRDARTGQPLPGFPVMLRSGGAVTQSTTSNQYGEFVFTGLTPGDYVLEHQPNNPHQGPSQIDVSLSVDAGQQVDLPVYQPEPDRGACCKPYGAPPARRRLV